MPGSKSLTNRSLVLAALAAGESQLVGALDSQDTRALSTALVALGAHVTGLGAPEIDAMTTVVGTSGQLHGAAAVHCGDGGTPARFLMAVAALAEGPVLVDGSARLRERPMEDGALLLEQLGVRCTWKGAKGFLPVLVHAHEPPVGGSLTVGRTASSQFVSALLLIAPWLKRGLSVKFDQPPTSASYIALTVSELRRWGIDVQVNTGPRGELVAVHVPTGAPKSQRVVVEADASSAVYFAAAAACVPGSEVLLQDLPPDSAQPDMAAIRALGAMGASVSRHPNGVSVSCSGTGLTGMELDCSEFPDGALAVIAVSALARTPSRFSGLSTLRVKECDRIHALAHNLSLLGARCETGSDWMSVQPIAVVAASGSSGEPPSISIPTFGDHRIAMA
ncbi:MAG: 3-phosphoshikimate 1-carboxyvinyltransferase, partial [Phycisphaerae bacterium]|nr:3-phosphoshikimate 1-carboxyvinyltransferase [Phycisphaerae bacterium]